MRKIFLKLLFCLLVLPVSVIAQRQVTGVVKDQNGPISNASVYENGNVKNGVRSDEDGRFKLTLRQGGDSLTVTSVGYVQQGVRVGSSGYVEVIMQPSTNDLNDVIVSGYGTTQRITNTGSISTIKGDVIRSVPTANVQNTLSGRLPGIFTQQRSGQPGKDAADYYIRGVSSLNPAGNQPLIIVDDIEYTYDQLQQINVNEIESISILKDAATTAIYGIKGANGVLVVTTRRGKLGRPQINVRTEAGVQVPTNVPNYLDAYNSALLVNEARQNDGLTPLFTQNDIDLFKTGEDPYGHPDVNWYNAIFKKNSMQANTNVDISGGTEAVKYFASFGAFTQNGSIKDFSSKNGDGLNTNYFFRRFDFRTNLDIQATRNLSMRIDLTGRFGMVNEPNTDNIMGEIYDFTRSTPYGAPFVNPDGSYAYMYNTVSMLPTLNERLALLGYSRVKRNDLNILFGAKENLSDLVKGLSISGQVAYASTWDVGRKLLRGMPPSYHYDAASKTYTLNPNSGYNMPTYALSAFNSISNKQVNLQGFLNYDRTFGNSQVKGLVLFNQTSSSSMASTPSNFRGYGISAGYYYKQKYLLDLKLGYNGSDRFKTEHRFGLFPAVSAGWNLAEEPFFKQAFPFIKLFKFRASYGLVGSDVVGGNQYIYRQVYNRGGSYSFGENNSVASGIQEGALGNESVTWEKKKSQNYALDVNLWDNHVSFTIERFYDNRYDQLVYPGSISAILGIGTAPVNIGIVHNQGWDLQFNFQGKIGELQYGIMPVISLANNKVIYKDEAFQRYPWLFETGHPIGQPFGYTWIGFYKNQADIDSSARPNVGSIHPGDLKYKDLNGDGTIDESDMSAIGRPNLPSTNIGLTLNAQYKGFNVSVLFQGAFNYSLALKGTGIEPFQSQFQPVHLYRWTPDNPDDALFPRLTTDPASVNSPTAYMSDFWLKNAHYIRLKSVELGYQVPTKWLPLKINNARLYFSAYNLFTWFNIKIYQQDPEVESNSVGDSYLNQRVMNLGLQIGF